jgi:type IV pilus assembly protein PilA
MFIQNLRAKVGARLNGDKEAGFTLIELLVVMLILGILAAIALPAFFNQKEKAGDAKAKEAAHTAQVALETYSTDNGGSYVGATVAKLKEIEPTVANESTVTAGVASEGISLSGLATNGYTISSVSGNAHTFQIINTAGAMTYPCTPEKKGGCPAGASGTGDWSK